MLSQLIRFCVCIIDGVAKSPPHGVAVLTALLLAAFIWLFPTVTTAAQLLKIDSSSTPELSRIILTLDENTSFKAQQLPASQHAPKRCYIDLYNTRRSQALPPWIAVNDANIAKIRTGVHATTFRIVLDLKHGGNCTISSGTKTAQIFMDVEPPPAAKLTQEEQQEILSAKSNKKSLSEPAETNREYSINSEPSTLDSAIQKNHKLSAWGWVQGFSAVDLKDEPAEHDQFSRLRARAGASLDNDLNDDDSLQAQVAIDIDYLNYDNNFAADETEINLHETYLRLNTPDWDFSLGKQQVRWGKSDQLSPLDRINPEDLRQFLTQDMEERKIPSWLARLNWYGQRFSIETILSPWFEKSELDYFDSDWALYRHLRQTIIDHPLIPPELKDYVAALSVHEQQPSDSLENMSAALRLTWQMEQTDIGFSYRYGWETLPTIISFPVKIISTGADPQADPALLLRDSILTDEQIEARYKRQQIIGFEWESAFEHIGFRGEIAHIDKVAFLTRDLTSQRKTVGHLVTGIDYTSETEWYFNLQASWYKIFDYDAEILYFERDNLSLLGEIRKSAWRGNLEFST
ncbi:MAG: AMIN domain-containing protein, partial [Thermodesulfobacteriota bacterium]|nr:AMIN domain-containing protein [Thermodesulfobacteriota bacterium]